VHIAREVQAALAVECHGERVVAVPAQLRGEPRHIPLVRIERAGSHGHPPFGIVESHVLPVFVGEQGEAHRMSGPDGRNIHHARDLEILRRASQRQPGRHRESAKHQPNASSLRPAASLTATVR
jgi:hypothetical protein